jgi:hypothetical protein
MAIVHTAPKEGDLVYCHAIGSKYGWYINQLGLILECAIKPVPEDPNNTEYKIWLMEHKRDQIVETRDFKVGNLEVVKKGKRFEHYKKRN